MDDQNRPSPDIPSENDDPHPGRVALQYSSDDIKRIFVGYSLADENGQREEMWYTWRLSGGNFGMFGEKSHLYGDGEDSHKLSQAAFKLDEATLPVELVGHNNGHWKSVARELLIARFGQLTRYGVPAYGTLSDNDAWVWFHDRTKAFPEQLLRQVAIVQQRKEGLPIAVPLDLLTTIRSWAQAYTNEENIEFMWFHEEYMDWVSAVRLNTTVLD